MEEEEKINKLLPITGVIILVLGLSLIALVLIKGRTAQPEVHSEPVIRGVNSARNSARYLRDIENMILGHDADPADLDKKWRWAWQEADEAKQAGFDQEFVDNLYCSLAGYGTYLASGTGHSEGADCLRKAEGIMRTRYGKEGR